MFKIDWYKFILYNVIAPMRQRLRIQWLILVLSQLRDHWDAQKAYITAKRYDINMTGQVIYLEKALNDTFDNINRGIYLEDGNFANRVLLYDRSNPFYIYWRYNDGFEYAAGDKVVFGANAYESTKVNIGNQPNSGSGWNIIGTYLFVQTRNEYTYGFGFIVYVPITLDYDGAQMNALIDFRKAAGRPYKIQTY